MIIDDDYSYVKSKHLKHEIVDYFETATVKFNYAATLTVQNDIKNMDTMKQIGQRFVNRYNSAMGYNNYKRKVKYDKTKQAAMIAVIEGDGSIKKLHYHLALYKPDNLLNEQFEQLVKKCWREANNGNTYKSDVRPMVDFGWIDYITKEFTKNNIDALDIERTHIY